MTREMNCSQALRRISDVKGKLGEWDTRAEQSVSYLVKAPPAFKFGECMQKSTDLRAELLRLQASLAVTNAQTKISFRGATLTVTEAIYRLSELKGRISWFSGLHVATQAESETDNWEYVEVPNSGLQRVNRPIKQICEMPEAKKVASKDELQVEFNELNDVVETSNGRTQIIWV